MEREGWQCVIRDDDAGLYWAVKVQGCWFFGLGPSLPSSLCVIGKAMIYGWRVLVDKGQSMYTVLYLDGRGVWIIILVKKGSCPWGMRTVLSTVSPNTLAAPSTHQTGDVGSWMPMPGLYLL